MRSHCWILAMVATCLIDVGCGPAPQPVWNKDSRSFFYAHSNGSVAQYDLDKRASRTLLAAGDQRPRQIGLSPTLPFIAVAQSGLGQKGRAVQVGLISLLHGREIDAADTADSPWLTIQAVPFGGDQYALHCRFTAGHPELPARVELVDRNVQRRRVLLDGMLPENFLVHHLFPSPDGKHILVCLGDELTKTSWIHVVQPDGKILAKVDAGAFETGEKRP